MSSNSSHDANYHMRLLVDRVPSMLAYWDRDLRCRFANRAYEKWFGVDPDRLIGTSIRDLLGPQLFAMNEPYMRAALAGEAQEFERIVPGPGGVKRHSLAQYIPDIVDGVVRGFLVQVTEVTQLKEIEAALHREQQLRQQVEGHAAQLDVLLAERTEMLDVLAHEVRQPLNNASAALQSARAALRGMGKGSASEQLARAQAVLGQVLSGIDNTLAVAALLARPEPIQRDDTDIDTLVAVTLADMPASERHRVQVRRDTPTRTASMDMSLMRLALRNVLSNALKFSPPGTPVLVRLADSDAPLALVMEVSDRGTGIPPDILPRLFTRGTRGNRTGAGHGLGLYIVRQVMALHGGTVELAHTGRDGSTLRLVLNQTVA
ncbi:MAG TPA: PAS domain-containing sensor histidine kinase [Burkholderiaceae bacterium]|nr:PAS domain-containing sensor histidine kinase [Burkholderiaceae bacterium]